MHLIDGLLGKGLALCWGNKIVTLFSRSNTPKDTVYMEEQETTPLTETFIPNLKFAAMSQSLTERTSSQANSFHEKTTILYMTSKSKPTSYSVLLETPNIGKFAVCD